VAPHLRGEAPPLGLYVIVPMRLTPFGYCLERSPQALLHRLDVHREFASAAQGGQVRKTQEVKRRRPRSLDTSPGSTPLQRQMRHSSFRRFPGEIPVSWSLVAL